MKNPRTRTRSRTFTAVFSLIALFSLILSLQTGCSKREKTPEEKAKEEAATVQKAKELFDKGIELVGNKRFDEGIKAYEESLALSAKSPEAHSNLGFAYLDKFNAGKEKDPILLDKSLEHQRRATELDQNFAVAYYGMAMLFERKGDVNGALAGWREFMKLSPPHTKWWITAQKRIKELEDIIKKAEKEAEKKKKKK